MVYEGLLRKLVSTHHECDVGRLVHKNQVIIKV